MDDDSRYNEGREAHFAHEDKLRAEGGSPFDENEDPIPLESKPLPDDFLDEEGDTVDPSAGDFNDPDLITAR